MLRHKAWMSTAAYWLGLIALLSLPFYSENLLAASACIAALYFAGSITISVGYHRLFCHNAFKTYEWARYAFALSGVLFMYSSPLQWAVTHATHHKRSDTLLDPHPKPATARAMLLKGYRNVPLSTWKARGMLRQGSLHAAVDRYYIGIWLAMATCMYVLSPWFFFEAYLPALGLAHFVGALHNTFSHHQNQPRNLWWLEYLIPSSGEWLHKNHHDSPGRSTFRTQWWHLDVGAMFIWVIKSR
jgi:fatty-acid desaturase